MANPVSKDSVKWFVTAVVAELNKRNGAQFASSAALNAVKSDLADLKDRVYDIDTNNFVKEVKGKGLSSNDFTDAEKAFLNSLTKDSEANFNEEDVQDVFT